MKIKQIALIGAMVAGIAATSAYAAPQQLPGYTPGAEVIQIAATRGQIDTISNVIYSQIKGPRAVRQLRMSFLIPRTAAPKPAIVYFPGGGFTSADHEKFIEMRMALAQAGFVVAAAEYRTVPDTFPAPVQDGKAAVRYLREHAAEYGIDPQRIGVLGDSAGGYLAQMLGVTNGEKSFDKGDYLNQSSDVQAVVTLYGLSNLLNIGAGFPENIQEVHRSPASTEALLVHGAAFRDFPGAAIGKDEKKALNASPMGHINGKKPPFLILHGSADTLVSPVQSAQLFKALKQGGNPAEYVLLEGANHGDLPWYQEPLIHRVVEWFKLTLKVSAATPAVATPSNPNANL
ncbi:alpha/beta hydrolase [Candidatus Symbiopectobacterium sp. NZEC151]|uniref:alpha/beta hydrolase n=1 Tax=Candidatus Symbiopectobacterium sp. NZEC151 TaxID=2820470 RepID=UPI002226822B|nr:alpha/beta hydrolase [Candidatus Symbiopectobacterium sp. NZEC151]MCW2475477.1 alpha/beta hydrolase [Candidatus Symbiopectobacterium sp. NZEC151]